MSYDRDMWEEDHPGAPGWVRAIVFVAMIAAAVAVYFYGAET